MGPEPMMRMDWMSVRRGIAFYLKGWRGKLEGGDRLRLGSRLSKFGMTVQQIEMVAAAVLLLFFWLRRIQRGPTERGGLGLEGRIG